MKNVPNRTKIAQENKKCTSVAHYGIELPCFLVWPYVALYGLMWPYVALYGLMWPRMVLMLLFTAMTMCGLFMTLNSILWSFVTLYALMWPCMALCGLVWS